MVAYDFRWETIWEHRTELLTGLWLTIQVAGIAFALGCALGLPLAAMRSSRSPLLSAPATIWVALTRGVPLLVVLYWVYYAAANQGWFALSEFRSGAVALGVTGSGYLAENFRGAIAAIDPGQREAAAAVGLRPARTFVSVIAPQALRIALPSSINVFIALLKGATIVSIIGLADMFYVARTVSFDTFSPFELYTAAAVIIIAVTLAIAAVASLLERRLSSGADR